MSSGRGRGISNAPAWMSRQQQQGDGGKNGAPLNGGGGGGDDGDPKNKRSRSRSNPRSSSSGQERDQYGRIRSDRAPPRERERDRERQDRMRMYNDRRGDSPQRGGRHRDDFGPYGPRDRGGGPRGGRDRYDSYGRDRDYHRGGGYRGGGRDRGGPSPPGRRGGGNRSGIYFNSLAEERAWVEERRRKRHSRKSLFDVEPTPEQAAADARAAALSNFPPDGTGGGGGGGIYGPASDSGSLPTRRRSVHSQPQQTRHARRLYIGHLPPDLSEQEVHDFFRDSINKAMDTRSSNSDDPILSVYINHERRFAFVEFKTVEICTACLSLDGINILGKGKVKVKRPNDYNPAMAPEPHSTLKFDVSKLGIISGSVPDGPNKIFIGGLHYHLTEDQVMELLGAFGQIRAFHLVKADPAAVTSKGYCFVEYADPAVTPVAVMGLNGMDMGGGKVLSARMAAARGTVVPGSGAAAAAAAAAQGGAAAMGAPAPPAAMAAAPQPTTSVVDGVDVQALLDAAMGGGGMAGGGAGGPLAAAAPMTMPSMGGAPVQMQMAAMAGTAPGATMMSVAGGVPGVVPGTMPGMMPGTNGTAATLASAALDAAFGAGGQVAPLAQQPQALPGQQAGMMPMAGVGMPPLAAMPVMAPVAAAAPVAPDPTRVLVLLNMVTDEDLGSDEDHEALVDEVREECAKFGKLLSMKIPRPQDGHEASAVKKIFLEYESVNDATNAERELAGRQFGPNVVQVSYFAETEYLGGKLR